MSIEKTTAHIWATLSAIDCNDQKKSKNGFSYLPWNWAWAKLQENFPCSNYEESMEYMKDGTAIVRTKVSITFEGETIERGMWLAVMNHKNQAIPNPPATQIANSYMRCLVKNLAMFGLGFYIFQGLDDAIPNAEHEEAEAKQLEAEQPITKAAVTKLRNGLKKASLAEDEFCELFGVAIAEEIKKGQVAAAVDLIQQRIKNLGAENESA